LININARGGIKMAKVISMLDVLEENKSINKENELLYHEIQQLAKENAILTAENQMLKRYKELYSQYVIWKEF
jgi:hypothetical protein